MRPTSRQFLQKARTPAFLVSNITNIRYLTGVSLSYGFVLVKKEGYVLFVDSRYSEQARETAIKDCRVRAIDQLVPSLTRVRRCGFEAGDVTVSRLLQWKRQFKNTKFVHKEGIIEEFRRSKDSVERSKLRKADRITEEILARIPSILLAGVTEQEVTWKIESWARSLGAEGMAFESIVAFGPNTSRPHHHPTTKKLKKGQIVQIDIGAKYKGYCGDRSHVYFTGKPTKEQQRVFDVLTEVKDAAKNAMKAGASTQEIDTIARSILKYHKLERYFTHSLGHGVGLDIHEGISLSKKTKDQSLLQHEVVTVEPGVYFTGKWGMRLEEMVFVK